MSATRTQVYFSAAQRERLDQRARDEHKTLAEVVREAVERHLADEMTDDQARQALDDTFGCLPDFGERVPDRDEWERA